MNQTTDYTIFKKLSGNRPINVRHVQQLIDSIGNNNLLRSKPIIVNENMEIIDGQHRLEAAKSLNVPIFYEVVSGMKINDVALVNSYQSNWKMDSFLSLYCDHAKDQNYINLKNLIDKYDLSLNQALAFFIDESNISEYREKFKSGQFVFDDNSERYAENYLILINKIKTYYRGTIRSWLSQNFARAFVLFLKNPEIQVNRLFEQIDKYPFLLTPRVNKQAMLDLIYEIYNYRKHLKVENI